METQTILGVVTIILVATVIAIKACFASKCTNVNLCYGALAITRDVEHELPSLPEVRNSVESKLPV